VVKNPPSVGHLAEIHPGRQLEKIGNGIEVQFGRGLLGESWSCEQDEKSEQITFHGVPPPGQQGFQQASAARKTKGRQDPTIS
jgi:hypothetical protein